jgi:hypothetical protein
MTGTRDKSIVVKLGPFPALDLVLAFCLECSTRAKAEKHKEETTWI